MSRKPLYGNLSIAYLYERRSRKVSMQLPSSVLESSLSLNNCNDMERIENNSYLQYQQKYRHKMKLYWIITTCWMTIIVCGMIKMKLWFLCMLGKKKSKFWKLFTKISILQCRINRIFYIQGKLLIVINASLQNPKYWHHCSDENSGDFVIVCFSIPTFLSCVLEILDRLGKIMWKIWYFRFFNN